MFFRESLHDAQKEAMAALRDEIKRLPVSQITEFERDGICELLCEKYRFRDYPEFAAGDIQRDEAEIPEGSDYAFVNIYIPYKGDPRDFRYYHNSRPMEDFTFDCGDGFCKKRYQVDKRHLDRIDKLVEDDVKRLQSFVPAIRDMIPKFNTSMSEQTKEAFNNRLAEIRRNQEAAGTLSKSKFSVRKRNDGTEKVIVPVERKPIPVPKAAAPAAPKSAVQEYLLEVREYDDICSTITSMAKVMERTPSVFAEMNEEPLRTILLVALNGIYEGQATGETFNGVGKTDILIRRGDKNVFIAECLMWKGQAYLTKKMSEQLFQYAMWRDSKTALIVFNRGGNFTNVIQTMKETVKAHPQFVSETEWKHESGGRYIFRRHDDPQRQFVVSAMAFDVPTEPA